ncbi:MAG: IS1/IS6 family transposase [Nitrososphaerota archaeon]|nr:IS1/IS6 family transposase [Nitrososphaerota archaeon]MDG6923635.1 IS1/IS6 family transposase [Nitrososphaerota archaeon]
MTRGEILAKENVISENSDGSFCVPSSSMDEVLYLVRVVDGKYVCNCLDFKQRHDEIGLCKHAHAVKFWIAAQVELQNQPKPKVFAEDSVQCPKCASIRVVKYGFDAEKQIFKCKDCSHKFREISLLKKAHYSPELVTLTLDLYFSGLSLRKITRMVSAQSHIDIHYSTIYLWIQRFVPQISRYVNSLSPQLSDTWHVDEVFQKTKGSEEYKDRGKVAFLWNVMDRKTRFLLASKLSKFRDAYGGFEAIKEAKRNAHGILPDHIFTDGLHQYKQVMRRELPDAVHHWNAGIGKPHATNNRIERMNGTLRERMKVTRGWKSMESAIAEGQRIHYNFVKPHQELEGQTPAQRAGIGIDSKNKWLELLVRATSEK